MHLRDPFTVSEHSSIALSVTRGRNMISLSMKNLSAVSMRSGWPVFQERQRWSAINARAPSIWSFLLERSNAQDARKGCLRPSILCRKWKRLNFQFRRLILPSGCDKGVELSASPSPPSSSILPNTWAIPLKGLPTGFQEQSEGGSVGDYTLLGMEEEVAVERKTVPDLVKSIIQERKDFIKKCERLSTFKKKCLVIEGSLSTVKTPYEDSQAHPNAVLGSLLAAQERWNIPVYFLDDFLWPKNLWQAC